MIGAAIAATGSLANIGFGIADRIRAKKEYNKAQSFFEQNKFDIPEAAKASLDIAQRQASSYRMPGQDIAEERLGQATASGVAQARRVGQSPSDVLAMLSNLYGSQMQGEQNLALQGAQQYQANQRNFQNALSQYGQLENEKWKYNVLYPYQQMLGRSSQFQDRGTQELNSGFMGIAQTGAGYMQAKALENAYESWGKQQGFGQSAPGTMVRAFGSGASWKQNPLLGLGVAKNAIGGMTGSFNNGAWNDYGQYSGE